jgi:hypothetical protein
VYNHGFLANAGTGIATGMLTSLACCAASTCPAFAIKVGETAIRNCFRDQLSAIGKEGTDYMGNHPCVFTEIGIPYDMDNKYAYKTGDYTSQSLALDANHFALEGCGANGYTLWVYMKTVSHSSIPDMTQTKELTCISLE